MNPENVFNWVEVGFENVQVLADIIFESKFSAKKIYPAEKHLPISHFLDLNCQTSRCLY